MRTNPNSLCVHVLQISMRINLSHFRVFTEIIPEIYIFIIFSIDFQSIAIFCAPLPMYHMHGFDVFLLVFLF